MWVNKNKHHMCRTLQSKIVHPFYFSHNLLLLLKVNNSYYQITLLKHKIQHYFLNLPKYQSLTKVPKCMFNGRQYQVYRMTFNFSAGMWQFKNTKFNDFRPSEYP